MAYKFNNGRGAVVCDDCRIIFDADLNFNLYSNIYLKELDLCWRCAEKRKESEIMKVLVKKLHEDAVVPSFAHIGDAGADLYSIEDVEIYPSDTKMISTGIAIQLPPQTEAQIRPRSGLAAKHGITVLNSPGTVDCVPKGTYIETKKGGVLVEDIFKTKEKVDIYSYNEESHDIEDDVISDMWIVTDLNLIKIETETGTLTIPENKMVMTKRGWVSAINLNNDDEILTTT